MPKSKTQNSKTMNYKTYQSNSFVLTHIQLLCQMRRLSIAIASNCLFKKQRQKKTKSILTQLRQLANKKDKKLK